MENTLKTLNWNERPNSIQDTKIFQNSSYEYIKNVGLSVLSLHPVLGRAATISIAGMTINQSTQSFDGSLSSLGDMALTIGGAYLGVVSPRLLGLISGVVRASLGIKNFATHLYNLEFRGAAEDAWQVGSSVIYIASSIQGHRVLMAVSILIQSASEFVSAGKHIFEEIDSGNDNVMVLAAAVIQISLASMRSYQATDMLLTQPMKPVVQDLKKSSVEEKLHVIQKEASDLFTAEEMRFVIDKVLKEEPIEPSVLYNFGATRAPEDAFSSQDIFKIASVFGRFNSGWNHLITNHNFWANLHDVSFETDNRLLTGVDERINYEASRIQAVVREQAIKNPIVALDDIEATLVQDSLIPSNLLETFWKQAFYAAYEPRKLFKKLCWKENFEIAYHTQAFNQLPKNDCDNELLTKMVTLYPKAMRLDLRNNKNISSETLISVLPKMPFLTDVTIKCCGRYSDFFGYETANIDVFKTVRDVPHLRHVNLSVLHWVDRIDPSSGLPYFAKPRNIMDSYIDALIQHCPEIESIHLTDNEGSCPWHWTRNYGLKPFHYSNWPDWPTPPRPFDPYHPLYPNRIALGLCGLSS